MQYTLETGNSHKVDVFKKFVASEHVMEQASPSLHILHKGRDFFVEALLSQDRALLEFVQYKADFALTEETILNSRGASVCFFLSPFLIAMTPEQLSALPFAPPQSESYSILISESSHLFSQWYDGIVPPLRAYSALNVVLSFFSHSPPVIAHSAFSMAVIKAEAGFNLLLFESHKLMYAASLNQSNSEDVLYFTLAIMQDFKVPQDQTTLYYSSQDYDNRFKALWQDYFKSVLVLEEVLTLPVAEGTVPFDLKEFALMLGVRLCV